MKDGVRFSPGNWEKYRKVTGFRGALSSVLELRDFKFLWYKWVEPSESSKIQELVEIMKAEIKVVGTFVQRRSARDPVQMSPCGGQDCCHQREAPWLASRPVCSSRKVAVLVTGTVNFC